MSSPKMSASPATNSRTSKSSKKQSRVVILRLSADHLSRFAPKKESPSDTSTPIKVQEEMPSISRIASNDNTSDQNNTPAPAPLNASTPEANGNKKRPADSASDTASKAKDKIKGEDKDRDNKTKGKPGPKKKPRLEDGTIDHAAKPAAPAAANHRLGPKANQGNINANLRALDRTGTPCRRWQKKGFQLRSFTGITWELATWKGDQAGLQVNGNSGSSKDLSMQDSSDMKPSESDTPHGSAAGDPIDKMDIATPAASSPVATPAPSGIAILS